ncbi:MAG: tetratricopeptide repeat protein [Planctomycetota bacterium]
MRLSKSSPSPSRPRRSQAASLLLGALLLGSPLLGGCESDGPKIDKDTQYELYAETALGHYENEDYNRAESQALKALEIREDDVPMRLLVGFISLRRGTTRDLYVAEGLFKEMRSEDDPRVWLGLATARERIGLVHEQTAEDLLEGRRLPEQFTPEFEAGELQDEARQFWGWAIEDYTKALEFNPEYLKALNGMLRTHVLLEDRDQAEAFGLRLLTVAERERQALREQLDRPGRSLTDRSYGRLQRDYEDTFELVIETHLALHDLYRGEERLGPALEQLDAALALEPKRPELFGRRAELSMLLGRYDQALWDIDRLLSTSNLELDHPDIQRAFALQREARAQIAKASR